MMKTLKLKSGLVFDATKRRKIKRDYSFAELEKKIIIHEKHLNSFFVHRRLKDGFTGKKVTLEQPLWLFVVNLISTHDARVHSGLCNETSRLSWRGEEK